MDTILVTGSAGFIGANLVLRLLEGEEPVHIIGLDNLNDYYDPALKQYRLEVVGSAAARHPECSYEFVRGSIADRGLVDGLFDQYWFSKVVNLAAQVGVRNSIDNPVSLYAATKKSNELLAHCYSKLYDIPSTGLRFFTVYGPAGRPESLLDFVQTLQEELLHAGVLPDDYDFEAHKVLVPMQPGDVPVTYADSSALERDFGFTPGIYLRQGLRKFAEWYKWYYMEGGCPSVGKVS